MTRIAATFAIEGIFPVGCPLAKTRCYNGNGTWCPDMTAHNGKPGAWGRVTVMCAAEKSAKKASEQ